MSVPPMAKTPLVAALLASMLASSLASSLACVAEPGPGAPELEDPRTAEHAGEASLTADVEPPARDPSSVAARASATDIAWLPDAVRVHADAIDAAAARHGVDPRLVAIVVLVESGGRPDAVSPVGARGLMQIMPATASDIAQRHGLPRPTPATLDPIETNLDLGVRLLADLIADFGDPSLDPESVHRVATAYNGGSGVVLGSVEPSEGTRRYAATVVGLWNARDAADRP